MGAQDVRVVARGRVCTVLRGPLCDFEGAATARTDARTLRDKQAVLPCVRVKTSVPVCANDGRRLLGSENAHAYAGVGAGVGAGAGADAGACVDASEYVRGCDYEDAGPRRSLEGVAAEVL